MAMGRRLVGAGRVGAGGDDAAAAVRGGWTGGGGMIGCPT